jgi:signal transduction histidine kinase
MDALERWGYTPRRWRLGEVNEGSVTGDRDRLAAALDALIENAIAHTGPEDLIELSVQIADGQAVFAVTDSGCGIPSADLERIFDRFSRGHRAGNREAGGFGLGLPTAAAIAEAHHGSVRVRSAVDTGSTFELLVPVARAATYAVGHSAAD